MILFNTSGKVAMMKLF